MRITLLGLSGLVVCMATWLSVVGWRFNVEIPGSAIHSESGRAYVIDAGTIRKRLLIGRGDSDSASSVSTAALRENARQLGPAHSLHQDIRDFGSGRFSHWYEYIIFSSSDNTDPRDNGRKYALEITLYLPFYFTIAVASLCSLPVFAAHRELRGFLVFVQSIVVHNQVLRWTWKNVMPSLIGAFAVLLVLAAIEEAYFRITTPFNEITWPSRFDPRIGFLFVPNAELRYTNHLDFWVTQRINSLGFADREPNQDMLRRGCHVAFIGDSIVEAAQVSIDQKAQVILEKRAIKAHPEWQLTSSAFGYSGTGQLNQLSFYVSFVHNLRPKLVVLVFVSNDFANNSSVLEALRNGWHPNHPPRLFARRDPQTGAYQLIQIDPDWRRYLLKTETQASSKIETERALHLFLMQHSLFYGWLWRKLSPLHPGMASWLEGPTSSELIAMRIEALRAMNEYRSEFRDWKDSYDLDLDAVFYEKELPDLFSEALGLTKFALSEFQKRVNRDGGHLVMLTTSQMSLPRISHISNSKNDPLFSRRQFLRLESIARSLGIPVIDQYEYIVQNGGNLLAAQFKNDAHWTPQGHIWAGEMVLKYLERNPQICRSQ